MSCVLGIAVLLILLVPFHLILLLTFNRIVIAVSSGGQHTVMIAKDKVEEEEKEEETNGEGMEVNNGQEANGDAIQEEPVVNGGAEEKMEEN